MSELRDLAGLSICPLKSIWIKDIIDYKLSQGLGRALDLSPEIKIA
jgi:hypothetical protein